MFLLKPFLYKVNTMYFSVTHEKLLERHMNIHINNNIVKVIRRSLAQRKRSTQFVAHNALDKIVGLSV